MARADLSVAVLWHMHQPDYVDSVSQRVAMPWVRLHALAAYYDTVRAVREVPGARAVFNVVPILLRQLEELSQGGVQDSFLDLARPAPGDLSGADRQLLLQNFFAFNHGRRFRELPRLAELWQKRHDMGPGKVSEAAAAFSDEDLRDLQVGFHLAWSGQTLRQHDLVAGLFAKGRRFSEHEKSELLQLQHEFLGEVLPLYRKAAQEGSIEISCTPYGHPILPLLCDTESALEAVPGLTLPEVRLQQPGDAWYQVASALSETERLLGVRPRGMWPAEGSLSETAIRIFATEKVSWLGCDQDVLAMSLRGEAPPSGHHFQPFRWGGDWAPALFFRDKGLSDRIGFVYGSWQPQRAAADMVDHLRRIGQELPAGPHLVPIILDGENPWEGYQDQGMSFLQHLYRGVQEADGLRWTTFGDFLEQEGAPTAAPLPRLVAGSWIRNDFTTWIGHQEKNAGWERLHSVREWLQERLIAADALKTVTLAGSGEQLKAPDPAQLGPQVNSPLARAWQAMVSAEGSDWFWWYGDDHSTDFAREFDALFRGHLSAVYRHLAVEPDPVLQVSLLSDRKGLKVRTPRFPLQVTVDGRVSNYFEWLDAGQCEVEGGGAMHRTDLPLTMLYYGGSPEHLYLRLDPRSPESLADLAGMRLTVRNFAAEISGVTLNFPEQISGPGSLSCEGSALAGTGGETAGRFDRIVEIAVPWTALEGEPGESLEFLVALLRGSETELVIPTAGKLVLRIPIGPADAEDWIV